MCCCNNWNRCCRCCRCCASENNGATSGSLFSGLSLSNLSGTAGGRQVYLTIPAFLWSAGQEEDDDSCGCGCC